ncbi:MAG TPA: glycoside hydrolase family 16 protein [Candidatus Sulfomarinibacteraceae bacterium]|nr:glycoside hydrolase family 16 protein [Candidatus Sulfomarinibacteraceae bacterium]
MRQSTLHRSRIVPAAALALGVLVVAASAALAAGKPGYPTRVAWGGASWQVKTSTSAVGPGPCVFAAANVSVDAADALHLRISQVAGRWTCAEVIGPTSFGYGTYSFVLGPLAEFDPNVVLGLFTWSDRARYAHREIDIEVAKWGNASDATNAQFVVQPWDAPDHLHRFSVPWGVRTLQQFTWRKGEVSWLATDLSTGAEIARYRYAGSDVPVPGDERVRLNLWLFNGSAPAGPAEVVVESFVFAP